MLLPDPRKEIIVRRILNENEVALWFPGNNEAIRVNKDLAVRSEGGKDFSFSDEAKRASPENMTFAGGETRGFVGDSLSRKTSFTPPRTITLNTKYDGAVMIDVHTGYAVLVVSKTGKRKVVVGPETVLLQYDERLMALELSTGKPKTTDRLMKTAYLKVRGNTVSDLVSVETKDLVKVNIKVSYRVNFEGDDFEKWFSVENYVKFLTDHLRSRLRAVIKRVGIEQFHGTAADIVRDTVLGEHVEGGHRPGCCFDENDMKIYDVEVLSVDINDDDIGELLQEAQHFVVEQTLTLAKREKELAVNQQLETIKQEEAKARAETIINELELRSVGIVKKLEVDAKEVKANAKMMDARLNTEKDSQTLRDDIAKAELAREKATEDQRLAIEAIELEQRIKELIQQTTAVVDRATAIQPDFIAALHALGNKDVVTEIAKHLGPVAMLSSTSVADIFTQLTKGTSAEGVMQFLSTRVPLSKQNKNS
jgi:major vault protein